MIIVIGVGLIMELWELSLFLYSWLRFVYLMHSLGAALTKVIFVLCLTGVFMANGYVYVFLSVINRLSHLFGILTCISSTI